MDTDGSDTFEAISGGGGVDGKADLLAHLTRVAAKAPASSPLALRLCVALNDIVGVDGSSLSVGYGTNNRTVLCSTDPVAERIEDLQDVLREGPGLDAHRFARPIVAEAPEVAARWPMVAQALKDWGQPCSLVAVPVRPGSDVLGVITMHRSRPPALSVDLEEARFLADAIGVAVLSGFERDEPAERLWSVRDRVNQAVGMVVAQLRLPPDDALAVLRAHAFAHDTSVQSIATAVLDGELVFRSTDTTEGDERP
jgi:hypothetical protein